MKNQRLKNYLKESNESSPEFWIGKIKEHAEFIVWMATEQAKQNNDLEGLEKVEQALFDIMNSKGKFYKKPIGSTAPKDNSWKQKKWHPNLMHNTPDPDLGFKNTGRSVPSRYEEDDI